ncbi:hypothetical protein GCM10009743_65150 [Kribbella swartbergensis]
MNRGEKQSHDAPMPGLTVQRDAPTVALQAQLIGTLEIDTSTNCLVVRTPMGTAAGTDSRRHRRGLASRLECRTP